MPTPPRPLGRRGAAHRRGRRLRPVTAMTSAAVTVEPPARSRATSARTWDRASGAVAGSGSAAVVRSCGRARLSAAGCRWPLPLGVLSSTTPGYRGRAGSWWGAAGVRQAGAGHAHQQLQRPQQRHGRQSGKELGAKALGGVGDVEGDRDGGRCGDQGPGVPGVTPGVPAQMAPQDDQAGRGGEGVDQQRRRPGQGGWEGGGLDGEGADGLEADHVGEGGDGQHQGGEGGDQGDADGGQQPHRPVAVRSWGRYGLNLALLLLASRGQMRRAHRFPTQAATSLALANEASGHPGRASPSA